MATTHVFIVDTQTFMIHLEYLFSGTGSKDYYIDFNNKATTSLPYQRENSLVSMIADSQRVRKGDFIIFYLQQNSSMHIYEGMFFGVFRATEEYSFFENNEPDQYLKAELGKSLTFRTIIEPYEVYPIGVTEWEALDEIKNINSPHQMLWSLIYRKLKGNRGNTMITIYESERLFKLLRDKNQRQMLNNDGFSFDKNTQQIINASGKKYKGKRENINIFPRLERKYTKLRAFETHLQAYILSNIGRNTNTSLDDSLIGDKIIEWLGNEVSCGFGMQRIDIAVSLLMPNSRILKAIELKACEANSVITNQLQRYVDWLEQYYIPNRVSDIQPVIIAKKIKNKNNQSFSDMLEDFEYFNKKNNKCYPIKYIEYQIKNHSLVFNEINYN